jgi:MFS transporter, YNFM family, putative membrane transport protein
MRAPTFAIMPDTNTVADQSTSGDAKIVYGTAAFWRTNLALFSAGFATFAVLYCVQPLLPLFSRDFGVSAAAASLAVSVTTGCLSVSMLVAGMVSEVYGRKPVMSASLLLSSALTVACAFLQHWPALLVLRALAGITLSGLPAVAMAYVGEEMHPQSLGVAMGLYVGGTGFGGMAGRLLSGVVTDFFGWRAAVCTIGLLGVAAGAILWTTLPPSRHFVRREPRLKPLLQTFAAHLHDPVLRLLFVEGFLLMGGFVTVYNYVGYHLLAPPFSLSQAEIGLVFIVYLCGIVSATAAGNVSRRWGRPAVLPAGILLMLLGMLLTLTGVLWLIVLGIALLTAGFFAGHAIASAWIGARASSGKAQASSLYMFAYYLGSSVLGSLGGVFWVRGGWAMVVAMTCVLMLIALSTAWRLSGDET